MNMSKARSVSPSLCMEFKDVVWHGNSHALIEAARDLDLESDKDERTVSVYKATCTVNGKGYVGQTVQAVQARWRAHCLKGSRCWALVAAIKTHGKEAFVLEVLASGLQAGNEADKVETAMIIQHGTLVPDGYNLYAGGNGVRHGNATQSENMRRAWQDPEKRARHMAWRTTEKLSAMANSESQWMAQQNAWLVKRFETALKMPLMDAIQMIAYRTKKSLQQATRQGRDASRKAWMVQQRDEQIQVLCQAAGVPVPPASSWEETSTQYERKIAKERGWKEGSGSSN